MHFINNQIPKPHPDEGQALVSVRAFGINRMDIIQRQGGYPLPPQAPATLGVEFSGVIESPGSGDHGGFSEEMKLLALPMVVPMLSMSPSALACSSTSPSQWTGPALAV